jgi:hypothetical protein
MYEVTIIVLTPTPKENSENYFSSCKPLILRNGVINERACTPQNKDLLSCIPAAAATTAFWFTIRYLVYISNANFTRYTLW